MHSCTQSSFRPLARHRNLWTASSWISLRHFGRSLLEAVERRYFCAQLELDGKMKYLMFLRTVQCSRSAPLSWARLAALAKSLTQSLFKLDKVSLHCFVDDPVAAVKGTEMERVVVVAPMALAWEALRF